MDSSAVTDVSQHLRLSHLLSLTSTLAGLHELYFGAKALFDLVAPQEYGIDMAEKERIGVLTSLPLLRKIVEILVEAKETSTTTAQFFFTK